MIHDRHVVWQRLLGSSLAGGVERQHNLDLDSKHTLPQENVSASRVDVVVDGVSRVDHETVHKLHGLGPLAPQLSAHDHLATLGSRLHDKSEDTIASTPHGETANELVPQGLGLSNSAKTSSLDLLGIQLNGSLWEVEPLLDDAGQLPDPPALLSQHVLGPSGHDDDLRPGGSHADLNAGVSILGELSGEELVELGLENSVGDPM